MGGLVSAEEQPVIDTDIAVKQALKQLSPTLSSSNIKQLYTVCRLLNMRLRKNHLIYNNEQGKLYINPIVITLWKQSDIELVSVGLINHLLSKLEETTKKTPALVKLQEWRHLHAVCLLLLFLSCSKLYYTLNNIEVLEYSLSTLTLEALDKEGLREKPSEFEETQKKPVFMNIDKDQIEKAYKCILISLGSFISLETSFLSRSEATLEMSEQFAECLFVMFVRLYFSSQHHEDLKKRAIKVNNQANLENASYFLGKAICNRNSQLFNISTLFIVSLIWDNKTSREITSLPSHLFKQLPTLTTTNIYDFIFTNILFSLIYQKKEDGRHEHKMQSQRFYCYRLLLQLLKHSLVSFNKQSAFYLENLCLFVKPNKVQRIYTTELVNKALIDFPSEVLKKYTQFSNTNYEVTFSNRTITMTPTELRCLLQPIGQTICDEANNSFQQYILHRLADQPESSQDSEKCLWDRILSRRRQQLRLSNGNF